MSKMPSGTVTFLFTDVQDSTRLWEQNPAAMRQSLVLHDELIESLAQQHNGYLVRPRGEGDSRFVVFVRAIDGVSAAAAIQRALHIEPWPEQIALRVRMGVHTGEGEFRDGDYYGTAVNRCARLRGIAHGGQTVLSQTTFDLVQDNMSGEIALLDLGKHYLKGLTRPEHIFQIVAPELPKEFPPLRSLDYRPNNLPVPTTPFIGRESEIAAVEKELSHKEVRLITILGPGGMGKTRLALEVGTSQLDNFTNGVYFISLAPLESADNILSTIAEAVNFQFYPGVEPKQQILDYFCKKRTLLLMDNFEHLLDGADLVTEILQTAQKVKILATSRVKLNLSSETVYTLKGMAYPKSIPYGPQDFPVDATRLQKENGDSAVKLFVQCAQRSRPGFDLHSGNMQNIAAICRLVDGLPLGIELAAAWSGMLSTEEIVVEIKGGIDFLVTDARDIPERHHSIRAVLDRTWEMVGEKEREVFKKLAVFRGGFTREAAQQVAGASLQQLLTLVNKSLIHRDRSGRYQIHELLRQFAGEALEASGQSEAVCNAHSEYYANALHQRLAGLKGRNQLETLADIEIDFENVRMAWRWAVGRGDFDILGLLIESVYLFGRMRSRLDDVGGLLSYAREELTPLNEAEAHQVWGRIITLHEMILYVNKMREEARQALESALAIARLHEDGWGEAFALWALAEVAAVIDFDYESAASLHEKSAARFEELNERYHWARVLLRLGHLYHEIKDYDLGRQIIQQGLDLTRQIGDRFGSAEALLELGFRFFHEAKFAEAEACYRESGVIYRELGSLSGVAILSTVIGYLAELRGDYDEARRLARETLEIGEEINNPRRIAHGLANLGSVEIRLENYEKARQLYEEALSFHSGLDRINWGLSMASTALGDIQASKAYSYDGLKALPSTWDRAMGLTTWLFILGEQGKKERAVEIMALIFEFPLVEAWIEGYPWFKRLRAELEAELSPDEFAAAWERGKSLDVDKVAAEVLADLLADLEA
jgi:predicted ATPase/class 3 adenylate cyclase